MHPTTLTTGGLVLSLAGLTTLLPAGPAAGATTSTVSTASTRTPTSTAWRPAARYLQPAATLQPARAITVGPGWTGVKVSLVQQRLGMGSRFEVFDTATRNRLLAFQKAQHLPATGRVDTTTWARLRTGQPFTIDTYRPTIAVTATASRSARIETMIGYAQQQRGAHYTWGSAGPKNLGFDCSGLVLAAMSRAGIDPLPITVNAHQSPGYLTTQHLYTHPGLQRLPVAQRQRGDLVFYLNPATGRTRHVAIYLGGGKMIEASSDADAVRIIAYHGSTPGHQLASQVVRPFTTVVR